MQNFNPRSPRGGATTPEEAERGVEDNFNPRSPRGGATRSIRIIKDKDRISILAPHEGERRLFRFFTSTMVYISILAPHEGERRTNMLMGLIMYQISILAPHEGERRC